MGYIARYDFAKNDARDTGGNSLTGTGTAVTYGRSPMIGAGGEVRITSDPGSVFTTGAQITTENRYSFTAWFRPQAGTGILIGQHDGSQGIALKQLSKTQLAVLIDTAESDPIDIKDTYNVVTIAYGGDVTSVYLNGVRVITAFAGMPTIPAQPIAAGDGSLAARIMEIMIHDTKLDGRGVELLHALIENSTANPPIDPTASDNAGLATVEIPWTPQYIDSAEDILVWVDASDADSLTLSGDQVLTWADKSGKGNDFVVQSSNDPTKLDAPDRIRFNRDGHLLVNLNLNPSATVFIVYKLDGDAIDHIMGSTGSVGGVNDPNWAYFTQSGSVYIRTDTGNFQAGQSFTNGQYMIATFTLDAAEVTHIKDGDVAGIATGTPPSAVSHTVIQLGWDDVSDRRMAGDIQEIIICDGLVAAEEARKVEGYLSHKWGHSLNAGHPFAIDSPTHLIAVDGSLVTERPWDISDYANFNSEVLLWLDAADTDVVTADGDGVSTWEDKGPNSVNATQLTTNLKPGYGTTTLNDLNTVDFQQDYLVLDSLITGVKKIYFVVTNAQGSDTLNMVSPVLGDTTVDEDHVFLRTNDITYSISIDGTDGKTGSASVNGAATETAGTNIDLGLTNIEMAQANLWTVTFDATCDFNLIGRVVTANLRNLMGEICEIILLNAEPTAAIDDQIQGYLAWKWGIGGKLASGHAHESEAPLVYLDEHWDDVQLLLSFDGDTTDTSQQARTVTDNGATFAAESQFGGQAAHFDADADHVEVTTPIVLGTNDFTIEGWVRPWGSGQGVWRSLVNFEEAVTDAPSLWINTSNQLEWWNDGASVLIGSGATVTPDTWQHFACTRKEGVVTLWLGGVSVGTVSSINTDYACGSTVHIGNTHTNTYHARGNHDEYRITVGTARYATPFTPPVRAFPIAAAFYQAPETSGDEFFESVVGLFPFDDDILDDSNQGLVLTANNGAALSNEQSKWGAQSLKLDQNTKYLQVTGVPELVMGTGPFTIETWIYPISLLVDFNVMSNRAASGNSNYWTWTIETDGAIKFQSRETSGTQHFVTSAAGAIVAGQWQHIAVVRNDAGGIEIFVDGTFVATGNDSANDLTDDNLIVGAFLFSGFETYSNAYYSDVRVTPGVARYAADFIAPVVQFPNTLPAQATQGDEHWSKVSMLLPLETDATDLATFPNTVTNTGGVTFNGAAVFDASAQLLSFPGVFNFNTDAWTIEFELKLTGNSDEYARVFQSIDADLLCGLGIGLNVNSDTTIRVYSDESGTSWDHESSDIVVGQNATFTHIAIVYFKGDLIIFVDGTEHERFTTTMPDDTGNTWILGGQIAGTNRTIHGEIRNFRITEIARYTVSGFSPPIGDTFATTDSPYDAQISNVPLLLQMSDGEETLTDGQFEPDPVWSVNTTPTFNTTVRPWNGASTIYHNSEAVTNVMDLVATTPIVLDGDFTIDLMVQVNNIRSCWVDCFTDSINGTRSLTLYSWDWSSGTVACDINSGNHLRWAGSQATIVGAGMKHLAIVREGTDFRMFWDGVLVESAIDSSSITIGAIRLAQGFPGAARGLNGYIGPFRLTKGVARYPGTDSFQVPYREFSSEALPNTGGPGFTRTVPYGPFSGVGNVPYRQKRIPAWHPHTPSFVHKAWMPNGRTVQADDVYEHEPHTNLRPEQTDIRASLALIDMRFGAAAGKLHDIGSAAAGAPNITKRGTISGTVTNNSASPLRRRIRCYDRKSGWLVAETWSTELGAYQFDGLELGRKYTIVGIDYENEYNAVIADNAEAEAG